MPIEKKLEYVFVGPESTLFHLTREVRRYTDKGYICDGEPMSQVRVERPMEGGGRRMEYEYYQRLVREAGAKKTGIQPVRAIGELDEVFS